MERFWKRVDIRNENECWNWLGATVDGYGIVSYKGKSRKAHRVSYELEHGTEPVNVVDHLCKNRLCVNPKHLEDVTKKENNLRGDSFSGKFARRTHCGEGHPFDESNTVIRVNGYRDCKECRRIQSEKQRRKNGVRPLLDWLETPRTKRTHCKRGHEFNEENTRLYKGAQHCKECIRIRNKGYYRARRN